MLSKCLYDRQVDVWMGYAHDEPITAEVAGYKVNNIYPADYGVGGYEGLLLTNESMVNPRSGLVSRFVGPAKKDFNTLLSIRMKRLRC